MKRLIIGGLLLIVLALVARNVYIHTRPHWGCSPWCEGGAR